MASFNRLARADSLLVDPPRTVGDVIGLCTTGQLREIDGLGPRRISEIEAALVLAGLDITGHPPPAAIPRTGKQQPLGSPFPSAGD